VGACFFWYRLTRVVRTEGRKTVVVVLYVRLKVLCGCVSRLNVYCRVLGIKVGSVVQLWLRELCKKIVVIIAFTCLISILC